jgi:hypothetical protein
VHKRKEVADNDAEIAKNRQAEAKRIFDIKNRAGFAFGGLGAKN